MRELRSDTTDPADWRRQLLLSYSTAADLAKAGLISVRAAADLAAVGAQYKMRITPYYASLMTSDPACPIRKQAIPDPAESDPALPAWASELSQSLYGRPTPWDADAIGDIEKLAAPRLTHRYENRAILHLSSACAVYCRFCFRKGHLNDSERTLYEGTLDPALRYLAGEPSIRELILTGGDPLSVPDAALARLLDRLHTIEHLRTVRIHSRMPVTLPHRLTPSLARILGEGRRFRIALVSHFNHARELTAEAMEALDRVARAGARLYNQAVLLKGVNDSVACLQELFQRLYEGGVTPLYLHHPDWTPGTFHFRVPIEQGRRLVRELRGRLSGPAFPEYVLDLPQGGGKVPLLDSAFRKLGDFSDAGPGEPLGGALYETAAPHTRAAPSSVRYLDLFRP